jgi:hypothetical protein
VSGRGDGIDRAGLRRTLTTAHPWLAATEVGPRAVDAGECDRCGAAPRLLPTCGPVAWTALCRDCALVVGDDGWCDGHAGDGAAARRWAAGLPPVWATVTRLWWVATGEVSADRAWIEAARAATSTGPRAPRLPP